MAEPLVLKTEQTPSFFNKNAVLGAVVGATVASFAPVAIPGLLAITAISAVAGGVAGKMEQERENRDGKVVKEPSFWNKDTLIGGMGAWFAARAFNLVVGKMLLASLGPAGAVATMVAVVGAAVVAGSYFGGKHGQKEQEKEYEEARQQSVAKGMGLTLSPDLAKSTEYEVEHTKDWRKTTTQERLVLASQDHTP